MTGKEYASALFDLYYDLQRASNAIAATFENHDQANNLAPDEHRPALQLVNDMLENALDLVDATSLIIHTYKKEAQKNE